jgi:hypothetical protein
MFVERLVPGLQHRSIFRRHYEGTTLREQLGLPQPNNQFSPEGRGGTVDSSWRGYGEDSERVRLARLVGIALRYE